MASINHAPTAGSTASNGRKLSTTFPLRQPTRFKRRIHEGNYYHAKFAYLTLKWYLLYPTLICLIEWQIWREYDADGSGFIEADELKVSHSFWILYEYITYGFDLLLFNVDVELFAWLVDRGTAWQGSNWR